MKLFYPVKKSTQKILSTFIVMLILFLNSTAASANTTLKVGVYNFAPLVAINEEKRAEGLFIDILDNIASKEQWNIEYVPGSWNECLERLTNGEIDILVSIAYSAERAKILDFTNEFLFLDWGLVYKKKGSSIATIFDLKGKKIAALKGSIYTEGFKNLLHQFGIVAEIINKDEYTRVFEAISSGEVDAGINAQVYGMRIEGNYNIERTQIYFSPVKIRFASKKGKNDEVLKILDKYISEFKEDPDSYYYRSYNKWMEIYQTVSFPFWIYWAMGILLSIITFILVFNALLRKQVKTKTRLLEESNTFKDMLLSTSPDIIYIYDIIKRENVYSNEGIMKVLGYSVSEIKNMGDKLIENLMHPEDFQNYLKNILPIYPTKKDGELIEHDYRMKHRDGAWRRLLSRETIFSRMKDGTPDRIFGIVSDITARKEAEENLLKNQYYLVKSQEIGNIGTWELDIKKNELVWTDETYKIFGLPLGTRLNYEIFLNNVHPDDRALVDQEWKAALDKKPYDIEHRLIVNNKIKWVREKADIEFDESDSPTIAIGFTQDITSFKLAEEQIKSNLKEKEILLHEINHRVKNNMQIITSLLRLQLNKKDKKDVDAILKDNIGRVYSMAAIHENLHQSENLSEIDFKAYLQKLTQMLSQTYQLEPGKITFQIDTHKLRLAINQANPLGLVLNELISNSLKYAFPDDQTGTIRIQSKIKENSEIELTIMDDGIGFPNGFDWKTTNSLGLRLVKDIVEKQLNGLIEFDATNGTRFTIKFNLESNYK